jgi:hypothetical protein
VLAAAGAVPIVSRVCRVGMPVKVLRVGLGLLANVIKHTSGGTSAAAAAAAASAALPSLSAAITAAAAACI